MSCSPRFSSTAVLTAIGVSLFLAARSVSQVLYQVRELTQIKRDEKEDHVIGEGTEEGMYHDLGYLSIIP